MMAFYHIFTIISHDKLHLNRCVATLLQFSSLLCVWGNSILHTFFMPWGNKTFKIRNRIFVTWTCMEIHDSKQNEKKNGCTGDLKKKKCRYHGRSSSCITLESEQNRTSLTVTSSLLLLKSRNIQLSRNFSINSTLVTPRNLKPG